MEKLSGKLNRDSVETLWERKDSLFKTEEADLSQVTSVDSAGAAFLVLWAKNTPSGKLAVTNMPEDAVKLMHLFRTEPLFEFRTGNQEPDDAPENELQLKEQEPA